MGGLIRAEWFKLTHDRSFYTMVAAVVFAYLLMLTGTASFEAPGNEVLSVIMGGRAAAAVVIASVFGGLSLGRDFESRTFSLPVAAGLSRTSVLAAKALTFFAAFDILLLSFPLLAVAGCSIVNGWSGPVGLSAVFSLAGTLGSLALLGGGIAGLSFLAACCSRSSSATIGIAVGAMLVQFVLLNSPYALQAAHFLPFCATWYVADGTIFAVYGAFMGVIWCIASIVGGVAIISRAELR